MRALPAMLLPLALAYITSSVAHAQAECDGWGDFRGIRVDGQLFPFTTSLCATAADGKETTFTAAEMVKNPRWNRTGKIQTCTGSIAFKNGQSLSFTQIIEDITQESARVTLQVTADADLDIKRIAYLVNVPAAEFDPDLFFWPDNTAPANGLGIKGPHRRLGLYSDRSMEVVVSRTQFIDTDLAMQEGLRLPRDPVKDRLITLTCPISDGKLARGQSITSTFTLTATGDIDKKPVTLTLDATHPGPAFLGIGGNFRMQSPADAAHIASNLDNLRIPWSRVSMPLDQWQSREEMNPLGENTRPNAQVTRQMDMARTLARKKIPLIISIWSYPEWSHFPPHPPVPGRPANILAYKLKPGKTDAVYQSIIAYLQYLKKNYQVEPALLSLNEPDLGIDVLQTPDEHAVFIKQLGAKMFHAGLTTRMLLADACSPHPVKFPDATINDPDARKYIGGISFHSWHDGTREEFIAWGNAARKLNVPLFIGEGGTDSDAYRYPSIFQEPWFAMHELDTYLNICNFSQPASILQWQLTQDYSIFSIGFNGQLQPTRRFFQLKQLNLTPPGTPALPITADSPTITAAAHGDPSKGILAIHLLNNGATRKVTITGIPNTLKELHVYTTDATRNMTESPQIPVKNDTVIFTLDKQTCTTFITAP